jgi:hypothetical protein
MEDVGIFYGHLVYFTAVWYILLLFGIFSPGLVSSTEKNLATLDCIHIGMYIVKQFSIRVKPISKCPAKSASKKRNVFISFVLSLVQVPAIL